MKKIFLLITLLMIVLLAKTQVSVTATAGTTGPTPYTTVNAAFAAINAGTHQGAITISITGNTTEPSTPTALFKSGAPSSYTSILIQPVGGSWTVNSPAQTDNTVMIDFAGADNITVDGDPLNTGTRMLSFVIDQLSGIRTAVFRLASIGTDGSDGAQNITIKNCNITGSRFNINAATFTYGIYMAGAYSATSITNLSAAACINNRFENNFITRCYFGIFISGTAVTFPANNLVIKNNIFGSSTPENNIGNTAISLTNTNANGGTGPALVEGNDVQVGSGNPATTPYIGNASIRGIAIAQGNDGLIVRKNNVHDIINPELPTTTTGGQAFGIAITVSTTNVTIENNFIRDVVTSRFARTSNTAQGAYGIHINGATAAGIKINYNTVLLNTAPVNGSFANPISACLNILSTATGLAELKNNNFVNRLGGDSSLVIRLAPTNYTGVTTDYDYNNYFTTGANIGLYGTTGISSFANWQSTTGRDASSLNINPVFVSATDLHLSPASAGLDGQGIVIAGVTQDIDGDTRSTGVRPNGPDIGADEYVPGCGSANGGTAAASPTGPFCGSGSTTISATGYTAAGAGITYQWQSSADAAFTTPVDIGSSSPLYADLSSGTISATTFYRLKVVCTSASITAYSNVVTVSVIAPPSATIAYTGSPYCVSGGTVTVTLIGTSGGTFSSTSGLSINTSTGEITLATSTPGTYIVTYEIAAAGGCPLFSTTTSVTINANPNAGTVTGTSPLCVGTTTTYTSDGVNGGIWNSSNVSVATVNPSTGLVTGVAGGTANIFYTVTVNGCSSTAQAPVTITTPPNAIISYTASPYCLGGGLATVTQSGTTGGTYSSTAGLSINAATGAITLLSSNAGTYIVTYTIAAGGGCAAFNTTASVTLSTSPSATIAYSGSPYCSNAGTATATQTGTSGGTYSSTSGLSINASTGAINLAASIAGTYTVTYTIAASGGCATFSTTASVTVNETPNAGTVNGAATACSGTTTLFTTNGTAGGTWSSSNTSVATVNASTGLVTAVTGGTTNIIYSITTAGCSATAQAALIVTQAANATISYSGSPYCNNAGIATITQTGTTGGTYSSTTGLIIDASTGAIDLAASTAGTYTVTYTIASGGGCAVFTTTTSVTITAAPNATINYSASPYCSNAGTATVTQTGTSGGVYSSTSGLSINPSTGVVNLSASTAGTYIVTYTIAPSGGCTAFSTTATITITAAPTATINYSGSPYCINGGTAVVTRSGTAGGTYSSTNGLSINATTGTITLGTSTAGSYTVTYTLPAVAGCAAFSTNTTVTISALPNAGIVSGSAQLQVGQTAAYASNGISGGSWSSSNTLVATVSSAGQVTAVGIGTAQIIYTVSTPGCTAVNAQATVGVFAATLSNIYPNPASDKVYVVTESAVKQFITILVMDITGRQMIQQSGDIQPGFTTRPIDIRTLAGGMYVLKIFDKNGKELFTGRFIKQQ